MRVGVLWTNLSRSEMSRRLRDMGTHCSRHTVRKLLKKHGLGQRKAQKKKSLGTHCDRNAQFEYINALVKRVQRNRQPVISVDTKKKEILGEFRNGGQDERAQVKDAGQGVQGTSLDLKIRDQARRISRARNRQKVVAAYKTEL